VGSDAEPQEGQEEGKVEEGKEALAQEERKTEQEACESFMNLGFSMIIKKVLEALVFPIISETVERVLTSQGGMGIKGKISLGELKRFNMEVHLGVMKQLFTPVKEQTVRH
jgi:hypothetical protein